MAVSTARETMLPPGVLALIDLAIEEDLGRGDATTNAVFPSGEESAATAHLVAREPLVVSGLEVARAVFARVDRGLSISETCGDGAQLAAGERALVVRGAVRTLLAAERTALNFVQRLSGVATLARKYSDAVAGTSTIVVDTRKTTPGYRWLEKRAVVHGGCRNHRADLGSGILIKDNHISACGSVTRAVECARKNAPHSLRVQVEVDTRAQLQEALAAGAELVLLDNMTPSDVAAAVEVAHRSGARVEVSGGITLDTVAEYARAGADYISCGALTHSAPAVDLALDFVDLLS